MRALGQTQASALAIEGVASMVRIIEHTRAYHMERPSAFSSVISARAHADRLIQHPLHSGLTLGRPAAILVRSTLR